MTDKGKLISLLVAMSITAIASIVLSVQLKQDLASTEYKLKQSESNVDVLSREVKELDNQVDKLAQSNGLLQDSKKKLEDSNSILQGKLEQAVEKSEALGRELKRLSQPRATKPVSRHGVRFTGKATAYSGDYITASGTTPTVGRTIAVDPRMVALGSSVHVSCKSYPEINGVYKAEDSGRLIKKETGRIVDVFLPSNKVSHFGVRDVTITVLPE